MEDEMERLRLMLGEVDIWERPEEAMELNLTKFHRETQTPDVNVYSNLNNDEKILHSDCRTGLGDRSDLEEAKTEVPDLISYGLSLGDRAPLGEKFCPLQAFAKFPYKYVSATYRDNIAKRFFANGGLYEREWDYFYIWPPEGLKQKAVVLLPALQVERFLLIINDTLGTRLRLPDSATTTGLIVEFPVDGTPRPRYLGRAGECEQAEYLKRSVPGSTFSPNIEISRKTMPTEEAMLAFQNRMQLILENDKHNKAASKAKKKADRLVKKKAWHSSIQLVQRYFGIREKSIEKEPGNRWKTSSGVSKPILPVVELQKPAPFIQEDSVVFICVDVESYERDHSLVTEIGFATLDTADILHMAPGKGGKKWFGAIRARHLRVREYAHLHNIDFVQGCADHFRFGESEWISIADATHEVARHFKEPYSRIGPKSTPQQILQYLKNVDDHGSSQKSNLQRNIVIVGHNVEADIAYLRRIGYNPHNLANLKELVDTVSMYRAFRDEENPRNLGSILADLDISASYLHNAGNDAVYTLQAMIGIAITAVEERQERKAPDHNITSETYQSAVEIPPVENMDERGGGIDSGPGVEDGDDTRSRIWQVAQSEW